IEGGVVPANGDCIRLGKAQVGEVTSAMKSPVLGKTIALARVDVTHAEPGTALEVGQLDGQTVPASQTGRSPAEASPSRRPRQRPLPSPQSEPRPK
ncbi:MAG: glycine cleavage T C-terminal barrel domain-containing protein, partial [Pseudomonadota bacterium]